MPFPLTFLAEKNLPARPYRTWNPSNLNPSVYRYLYIMQSKGLESQAKKTTV